eukprot:TRINITY_DN7207_c0_g1_i3.p1 TRINITY_DN7207_c0_g1~~TRINITY_DN7207_c0_g1_i3.p1  ORF type:complete len:141 (-),score=33.20 TRINITY_DN7207_c0_g1_i3:233-655(-)
MSVCEKGHTVLPKELAELADLPGNRFIGIKVDRGLDWVTALGGSTIKVSEDDIIFKPPAASPDLTAKISDSDLAGALGPVFFGLCFNAADASPAFGSSMGHQRASQLIFVMAAALNFCTLPLIFTLPRDMMKTKAATDGD